MIASKQLVTILVPVYNEEQNILPLVECISIAVSHLSSFDFEVLFVDDGSSDNTLKKIEQAEKGNLPVGYVKLSRNFGHQAALEAGLYHVSGDVIISMDGDLQNPPEMLPAMLDEYLKGADIVQMKRSNTGSDLKGVLSVVFYFFFSRVTEAPVVPNAADYRLMSRRIVEEIKKIPGKGKVLRAIIPALGFRQVHLSYLQAERKFEKPKYTFFSSYELAVHTLFKFSTFPTNGLLFTGTFLFLCASISLVLVVTNIVQLNIVAVHILLACSVSGLILFCTGILSWYLYFILEQVRNDFSYIVSKIVLPKRRSNNE